MNPMHSHSPPSLSFCFSLFLPSPLSLFFYTLSSPSFSPSVFFFSSSRPQFLTPLCHHSSSAPPVISCSSPSPFPPSFSPLMSPHHFHLHPPLSLPSLPLSLTMSQRKSALSIIRPRKGSNHESVQPGNEQGGRRSRV